MIDTGSWVLHTATCIVDRVKRVWSGKEGDRYAGRDGTEREHEVRIVELEGGDAFIDREGTEFQEIDTQEVGFVLATREAVNKIRESLERAGVKNRIAPRRVGILLASEFRYASRMAVGAFPPGSGG